MEISPKYIIKLTKDIEKALWDEYKSYKEVRAYLSRWQDCQEYPNYWEDFQLQEENGKLDVFKTLQGIPDEKLIKIAIDLGVETPHFIPAIPIFRNDIKDAYPNASETFELAFKKVDNETDMAIGLANSALESIIKQILNDDRIKVDRNDKDTLGKLVDKIIKAFDLNKEKASTIEMCKIGSGLINTCKSIEDLRSKYTNVHGKNNDQEIIKDELCASFIVNATATVGLFLINYYNDRFQKTEEESQSCHIDELPF